MLIFEEWSVGKTSQGMDKNWHQTQHAKEAKCKKIFATLVRLSVLTISSKGNPREKVNAKTTEMQSDALKESGLCYQGIVSAALLPHSCKSC